MRFHKLTGAGNDFVLLPERPSGSLPALARRLCDRRSGVGADGLLVLERGRRNRLLYYNADGSTAFCGNGSRCAAWWMHANGWTGRLKEFDFFTSRGRISAKVMGPNLAAIKMPEPKSIRMGLKLKALGRSVTAHAVDTGAPHAVMAVADLDRVAVLDLGRALRRHKAFAPAGVNADFMSARAGALAIRTYERGVENETPACGTGAAAAAIAASLLGLCGSPVRVAVRSGELLTVTFLRKGARFTNVWLEGPARLLFSGEITL